MFDIIITDKLISYCRFLLYETDLGSGAPHRAGNSDQQATGLIGQFAIALVMKHPIPTALGNDFDGGYDIQHNGMNIDVKTMARSVTMQSHYVHNFYAAQQSLAADSYIFCSLRQCDRRLTVCGWLDKEHLIRYAYLYLKGTIRTRDDGSTFEVKHDLYEVKQSYLNPLDHKSELMELGFATKEIK